MAQRLTLLLLMAASLLAPPSVALAHGEEIHLTWWQILVATVFPYIVWGLVLLGFLTLIVHLFYCVRWLYRRVRTSTLRT